MLSVSPQEPFNTCGAPWSTHTNKARTAARAIRAEEYVLPNCGCLARQHTIKIRLLTLNVKPASQGGRRRPFRFLSLATRGSDLAVYDSL